MSSPTGPQWNRSGYVPKPFPAPVAGSVQSSRSGGESGQPLVLPFAAIPVLGLLLAVAGFLFGISILFTIGLALFVIGLIVVIIRATTQPNGSVRPAPPIAYTGDGQPVYPIVGYTPDGAAVTADRAVGYQPLNPRTRSMAVAALVLGFAFPLLAIPFGQVARGLLTAVVALMIVLAAI